MAHIICNQTKIHTLIVYPIMFLFIYGFPFVNFPLNSSKIALLVLMTIFLLKNKFREFNSINVHLLWYFFSIAVLILASLIFPILHGTYDYAIAYAYFLMLFESFIGAYLIYILFLKDISIDKLLHYFVILALIQAIIIILMLLSHQVREAIFSISPTSGQEIMIRYGGFRGFGLAHSLTYDLSVFLSFSLLFISYLFSVFTEKKMFYMASWLLIVVAILLTARTGYIGVIFSIVYLLFNIKNKYILRFIFFMPIIALLLGVVVAWMLSVYSPELYMLIDQKILTYLGEFFINYRDNQDFSSKSTDVLKGMFFSINESTYLHGDGYYSSPLDIDMQYLDTDSGYMRHLLFYGLFPSVLLYWMYFKGFYQVYKFSKYKHRLPFLFILMGVYYFVVHLKGSFLVGSGMNVKLFLILLIFALLRTNHKSIKGVKNSNNSQMSNM